MYVCLGLRRLIYTFKSRGIGVQHPKLSPSLQILGLLRVAMSDPQNVWLLPPPSADCKQISWYRYFKHCCKDLIVNCKTKSDFSLQLFNVIWCTLRDYQYKIFITFILLIKAFTRVFKFPSLPTCVSEWERNVNNRRRKLADFLWNFWHSTKKWPDFDRNKRVLVFRMYLNRCKIVSKLCIPIMISSLYKWENNIKIPIKYINWYSFLLNVADQIHIYLPSCQNHRYRCWMKCSVRRAW